MGEQRPMKDDEEKSLSQEVADWERTLWERTPPGNRLAEEVAEWERTLWESRDQ